jgi:hypothetical protein
LQDIVVAVLSYHDTAGVRQITGIGVVVDGKRVWAESIELLQVIPVSKRRGKHYENCD